MNGFLILAIIVFLLAQFFLITGFSLCLILTQRATNKDS